MLVKGPFELKYGADILDDVESIDVNYDVDTEEYDTIQGRRRQISGSHLVEVTVVFLESDVPALAVVLPQYFVANGATLSTGETVSHADGAIDIVPGGCDTEVTKTDFVVTSCGNPGHVLRVVDCVTEIASMEIDNKVRKVSVVFRGESDNATIQMFREGAVSIVS